MEQETCAGTRETGRSSIWEEVKRYLRERLPEYMAPEVMEELEEMPLTANGKIDRKRLGSGKRERREGEEEGEKTAVEEIVAGIMGEVLKLERVGRRENFFEIGGHSLLATQVVSRVRSFFGLEIGVGSVFEEPKVAGLARKIEEVLRAGEKTESRPL